jgi:glycosyltransferase involved in cell wall biosynthesis
MIADAIRSVLGQTMEDLEVIVVDDRSTDETKSVIDGFRDPRLRYIVNPRPQGPSGARNAGILAAWGDWVGFLDSDDEWMPEKLERQLGALECSPDAEVIACGWRWMSRRTGQTRVERAPDLAGRIEGLPRWSFNTCPDILARRDAARETLFPEELTTYECLDWIIRLQRYRCLFVPDILVQCYDHEEARASDGGLTSLAALEQVVQRHRAFILRDPSAWATLNEKLGAGLLVADNDKRRARSYLLNTVRADPGRLRAWGYLLASSIPIHPRKLKWLKRFAPKESITTGGDNGAGCHQ